MICCRPTDSHYAAAARSRYLFLLILESVHLTPFSELFWNARPERWVIAAGEKGCARDDLCLVKPSSVSLFFRARARRERKSHPWPLVPLHLAWNKLETELALHNFFRACTVCAHRNKSKTISAAQSFIKKSHNTQAVVDGLMHAACCWIHC